MSAPSSLSLTQQHVYKKLSELACLYFTGDFSDLPTQPRLFPLVAGPTGAGKSFLVRTLANEINAHFMRICFGDWLPYGARTGTPTMDKIKDALIKYEHVILHLDELDKFRKMFDSPWSNCVANDIWTMMDRQFKLEDPYVLRRPDEQIARKEKGVGNRLWIVGSGTWQDLFDNSQMQSTKPTLGFAPIPGPTPPLSPLEEKQKLIREQDFIPRELIARFHNEVLIIDYPRNTEEITDMLERCGINRLASKLDVTIDPESISFSEQGLRVFESISADLLMKLQKRELEKARIPENEIFPAISLLNQRIQEVEALNPFPEPFEPDPWGTI